MYGLRKTIIEWLIIKDIIQFLPSCRTAKIANQIYLLLVAGDIFIFAMHMC